MDGNRSRGSLLIGVALLTAAFTLVRSGPAGAQVVWPVNGHTYQFVSDQIPWTDAEAAASASSFNGVPGHLATITSQAENDFILANLAGNGDTAWIGLSDAASEGVFAWVTGEPLTFTSWASGQPSAAAGDDYVEFVFLAGPDAGRWNALTNDFDGGRFYVVEYDTGGTLAPAPALHPTVLLALLAALFAFGCWRARRHAG